MNDGNVSKWCRLFNEGRTNVNNEERPERPTVINENLTQNVNEKINRNRRFTNDELHQNFYKEFLGGKRLENDMLKKKRLLTGLMVRKQSWLLMGTKNWCHDLINVSLLMATVDVMLKSEKNFDIIVAIMYIRK